MKNSILFLLLLGASLIVSYIGPWWLVAPISFIIIYYAKTNKAAGFLLPFFAVALSWVFWIYLNNYEQTSTLLGELFKLNAQVTPLLSGIVGGLLAGFFGISGALLDLRPQNGDSLD